MSASASHPDPRECYRRRQCDRASRYEQERRRDDGLSTARGLLFLGGLLLIGLAWADWLAWWWLLLPTVLFAAILPWHERIVRRMQRDQRAINHYDRSLARLDGNWIGSGVSGDRYLESDHPYAADLDVFGRGSLFELICRARTRLGEDTLAGWFAEPAEAPVITDRHAAVEELRDDLDIAEQLALLAPQVHDDQTLLLLWAEQPAQPISRGRRLIAAALAGIAVVTLAGWLLGGWPISLFLLAVAVEGAFIYRHGRQIRRAAEGAWKARSGLQVLTEVLRIIEPKQFRAPLLKTIRGRLERGTALPSKEIARLDALIRGLENSLQNQFFAPIAFLLGLPIHQVHALENWRDRVGHHIPDWLRSVGEFEALASLANHAFEHPDDVFAEIAHGTSPLFQGTGLSHPLLLSTEAVRNDVCLGPDHRLLLVSGSNMSGKSTLLRTVGTNAVLALAGGTVRGHSLTLTSVTIGTAMRIHDSLLEGRSLFYAVLGRLKAVVDLLNQPRPLLFLLDEILQGTNSHDRRIGSEAVIRCLVEGGAIGLVTTHDLALTEIVDTFENSATNVHFEDRIEDGQMTFDYRLRPGVVQRSNALELMRLIGLKI